MQEQHPHHSALHYAQSTTQDQSHTHVLAQHDAHLMHWIADGHRLLTHDNTWPTSRHKHEAARSSPQSSDQESGFEEHMSTTQVDLGPMTPVGDAQQLPPAITLSTDFLSAHGIATPANTVHPRVPTTGSTDQAETLPPTWRQHLRREMQLESKQFRFLLKQLGGGTTTSAPHLKPAQSQEQSTTSSPS